MSTEKPSSHAIEWSDLVTPALVLEHDPVDQKELITCLMLLTEQLLVNHSDLKKIDRILHSWSVRKKAAWLERPRKRPNSAEACAQKALVRTVSQFEACRPPCCRQFCVIRTRERGHSLVLHGQEAL